MPTNWAKLKKNLSLHSGIWATEKSTSSFIAAMSIARVVVFSILGTPKDGSVATLSDSSVKANSFSSPPTKWTLWMGLQSEDTVTTITILTGKRFWNALVSSANSERIWPVPRLLIQL